tara:strand:- start:24769 stop:25479 length:711 start_codon:yes stop_codon:yes gene_type:complete
MKIVFGTKKLSGTTRLASFEKYETIPVLTVEGIKGAKKSRRILLNTMASQLLDLEVGDVQELIFAPVEDTMQVLIANISTIDSETGDMVSYKTSKNKVSHGESNEKSKAITSSHMCKEIFSFLSLDETADAEFQLVSFPSDSVEAYSLEVVSEISEDKENLSSDTTSTSMNDVAENVIEIETDNVDMTAEELIGEKVQDVVDFHEEQVTQEESDSPVLQRSGLQKRSIEALDTSEY